MRSKRSHQFNLRVFVTMSSLILILEVPVLYITCGIFLCTCCDTLPNDGERKTGANEAQHKQSFYSDWPIQRFARKPLCCSVLGSCHRRCIIAYTSGPHDFLGATYQSPWTPVSTLYLAVKGKVNRFLPLSDYRRGTCYHKKDKLIIQLL